MNGIFNNWLEMDCFCMNLAEAWIKYRQSRDLEVSCEEFMEWVMSDFTNTLELKFCDVYEKEFGHREDERK